MDKKVYTQQNKGIWRKRHMQLHVTHVTRKPVRLILKEKHALRYCAAALSTRASLISPSVLTRTPISLPKKIPQACLSWGAACFFFFFYFFYKNLISCTCHCESCSLVDAAHWKRHHDGKKMRCVVSDLQDINKHVDVEKGEPLLQPDVYVGALLFSGLQVRSWELSAAWQLLCSHSCSFEDAPVATDAFQRRWSLIGS